ncbi:MAG: YciK family oxidoreductase [Gammaproteobacteria bacterium]|nr:YciK family oxidoreductase [Gammaproteobacteria bacterium]OUT97260.1 MAG: YciK family oxidoreductase [Gammaproteobacteria bacterium TMED36]|tara:strand:+ start:474 stop:1205 length:732 start_codon:yes stop_codon:yes gene_type:complete
MKLSDYQLKNKIILVTGANQGIGKAASIRYASLGAKVILLGRNLESLEQVYDEIIKLKYNEPMISLMDLEKADGNDYQAIHENLMNEFGKLDGLLLNASILGDRSPIAHYDSETWARTIHVNLTAQFLLVKSLLPALYESDSASVIFTSSGVGKLGKAFWGAYSVSKFGVEALSQILSSEHEDQVNIRFNCINPGATRTKMRKEAYPYEDEMKLKKPDELMDKYTWLMSDESKKITGQSIDCQ